MSELPRGWTTTTLHDVTVDCEKAPPNEGVSFTYIDIASVSRETKKIESPQQLNAANAPSRARKWVRRDDVIVSMTRPNLNAVAMVPKELDGQIASTGFDVLRAIQVEPRWIFFAVRSREFVDTMSDLVQGALYPAVKSCDVRSFELPLPPLSEQQRIADKVDSLLSRVDACRERLDRVPAILKRFRQSVLAAATSGKLTEDWREENSNLGDVKAELENVLRSRQENWNRYIKTKYKTPVGPDLASTLKAPAEWAEISLDAITSIITSGSRAWTKYYGSGTGTFIMAQNVRPGRLDLSVRQAVNPPEGDRDAVRSQVQIGDLLVTIVGANTGDVCPVQTELPEHYVCQSVALMRPVEIQHSDYLNLYLNAESHGKGEFARYMYGEGRPHLSFDQLRMTKVLLPPIAEQAEIVRRVHDLFSFANNIDMQLQNVCKRVSRLTPSLLAKAFRGQLVSQDPNDEPASALLERIRAAKSNIKAKTSRRKPKSKAT